jgi:fumarate hydratase class II
VKAVDEVIAGELDDYFPLRVWISGSGTTGILPKIRINPVMPTFRRRI